MNRNDSRPQVKRREGMSMERLRTTQGVHEGYQRITAGSPTVSDEQVQALLLDRYDTVVSSQDQLPGETDHNVHVVDRGGREFVLKVAHDSDRTALTERSVVLEELSVHHPELPIPRVVKAVDGASVVDVGDPAGAVAQLLTWLPGQSLKAYGAPSRALLTDVGAATGRLGAAMDKLRSAPVSQVHYWDLANAGRVIEECLPTVADGDLARDIARAGEMWPSVADRYRELPAGLAHHDLNVFNILVSPGDGRAHVSGIIDFGDMMHAARVSDLAILLSSIMRLSDQPLEALGTVTAAYNLECPLSEDEVDLAYPLAVIRTAVVAATTARMDAEGSHGDPRHRSSGSPQLLHTLLRHPVELGVAGVRRACGLNGFSSGNVARQWLGRHTADAFPVEQSDLPVVDLSATGQTYDSADPRRPGELREAAHDAIVSHWPSAAIGRHGEPRFLVPVRHRRGIDDYDVQLGITAYATPGTPVRAPISGAIEHPLAPDAEPVIRHEPESGVTFWTLLRGATSDLAPGSAVTAGEVVGHVRDVSWADGLPARLEVQVAVIDPNDMADVPHEVAGSDIALWQDLLPDPSSLFGLEPWQPSIVQTLEQRDRYLPQTHPTYFREPVTVVRGSGCWLYDEHGRAYLDALNNVTLVGHGHPRLVEAASRQMRRLNTNSRFVYTALTDYASRLTETLPEGLDVVYFVNSGSEANDLALRMARFVSGRQDLVVVEGAYHGNTALVSDVSPSRYAYYGKPTTTHPTPAPDRYRGQYTYDDVDAGRRYARHVTDTFATLQAQGNPAAAFIYEPLLAGGGQVVLPPEYLSTITNDARDRGVLTIADEVQVGFGRLGEAFWGFQTQGPDVVPDIVTVGKSMGNGFPVAAMITTREISQAFDSAGKYFSTYGGNPVSCVVGLELLDIMRDEGLQENARVIGQYWREQLAELGERHHLIGDVRGQGFYSGVEFVSDRSTKQPATAATLAICEELKDNGVMVHTTGPSGNVLKLKPPLTFTRDHVDLFVETLDDALAGIDEC